MESAIVTTKGQVVIPARIRRRLNIKKGTAICFTEQGNAVLLQPVTDEYIRSLRGSLGTGGKVLKALMAEKKRERER